MNHDEEGSDLDDVTAAADFADLSRELMTELEEQPTLQAVVDRAVAMIPAVDSCSVTLRRRRNRLETLASSSPLALECDQLQYALNEGPCVDAVWQDDSYLVEDVTKETRWPRWAARVAEGGIGSILAIRLSNDDETIGALNMYAVRANAFTTDDVDLALIFTTHAANALNSARMVTGLRTAMHSRHLIGVAQGILMARFDLDLDRSFKLLQRYSSETNTKLREVAEYVVANRDLPDRNGEPQGLPSQREVLD
jgi:GAF domain-containing protein